MISEASVLVVRFRLCAVGSLGLDVGGLTRNVSLTVRLSAGFAGLVLLSACASGGGGELQTRNTDYYVSHAAGNYQPPGPPDDPWGPYVNIAASRFDVPPQWIREVMQAESGGHEYMHGRLTVSDAGAMGLMELEPETYDEMAARYGLGDDPFNPYDNIMAGTAYIHEMYEVYGSPGFLAAYDAGPGRLNEFMEGGKPLPDETVNYIAMIAPHIEGYYPADRSQADQLALNTMPIGSDGGILPAGFDPGQPPPEAPVAPVEEVAAIVPSTPDPSAVYTPEPVIAPPAPPPPRHEFSLIPAAMADTPAPETQDLPVAPGEVGWAIQVGAYSSPGSANAALGMAELSAVSLLIKGHAVVVSYHSAGRTTYRARVVGLPHEDAVDACARLESGPTGCLLLSPASQS